MVAPGFARALPRVLVHEGGYANDPHDPGGATNRGVTHRVYDAFRKRKGLEPRDVRQITAEEIAQIYRFQYWDVVRGDELPAGVDYVVFDGAVNSGPSQSVKWLQRALGNVVVDGVCGQATLRAAQEHPEPLRLIEAICNRRMDFLRALRTWERFGKGWTRRVDDVRKAGKALALAAPMPLPADTQPTGKGRIDDARKPPGKGAADATTGGGIATGGLGGLLETIRQQLEPYAGALEWVGWIVAGLVIAGAVLTIGGIAYRWWANRKAAQLAEALS